MLANPLRPPLVQLRQPLEVLDLDLAVPQIRINLRLVQTRPLPRVDCLDPPPLLVPRLQVDLAALEAKSRPLRLAQLLSQLGRPLDSVALELQRIQRSQLLVVYLDRRRRKPPLQAAGFSELRPGVRLVPSRVRNHPNFYIFL